MCVRRRKQKCFDILLDGKMKLQISDFRTVDFRISTLPTLFGEKAVIRILNPAQDELTLDTIGLNPKQLELYKTMTQQPHGMILVTGPTGSGKTITLYCALQMLNSPIRNILSVEDPVEVFVQGINQVNVNEKHGLTFARTLRALLRQDPDVIMVGEIRDFETAEISIKAAQTGHLVLSTLHTNDAASALIRLLNMGIAPVNITSSVNLVIAQRLIRRLCEVCKRPATHSESLLKQYWETPPETVFQAVGCQGCTQGYRGRTGVFEVLPILPEVRELVLAGGSHIDLQKWFHDRNLTSIKQSGLDKVAAGLTSLEEVERITMSL